MSFGKKLQNNIKKFEAPSMIKEIDGKKDVFGKLFVAAYTETSDEDIVEHLKKGYIELYEFIKNYTYEDTRIEKYKTSLLDKYGNPYGPLKGLITELQFETANPYEKQFHIGVGEKAVQLKGIKKFENGNYVFKARVYMPQMNEQTKEIEFIKPFTSIFVDKDRFEPLFKKIQDVFLDIDLKKNLELPDDEKQSYDVIICSLGNAKKKIDGQYTNYDVNAYDVIVHAELNA